MFCAGQGILRAGDLDRAFDADVRKFGSGRAVAVQPDGKVIIGGNFSRVHGEARTNLVRLNTDGTLDADFDAGTTFNGTVTAIVVQPDGKILIGGSFTEFAAATHNRILRLNADGSLDTSFSAGGGFNGSVLAMARQDDGKLIVAGGFTTYNGTSRPRIARLNTDGSLDTGFNPGSGANDAIWDLALQSDGKVVATGSFTAYNGTTRNRIARLNTNGSLDTTVSFGTGANWGIYAVVIDGAGGFVVGGGFTGLNGEWRYNIGRFNPDGSLDADFHPGGGFDSFVADLQVDSAGRIVVAGAFTRFSGEYSPTLPGVLRLQDGSVDESFDADEADLVLNRSAYITAIAIVPGDRVLAVGHLYDAESGGAGFVRLASSGAVETSFSRGRGLELTPAVRTLVPSVEGKYYVGGDFDYIDGTPRLNIARFNADAEVDVTFVPSSYYAVMDYDGPITAIVERSDRQVWAFGTFSYVARTGAGTSSYARAGAVRFAAYGELQSTYDGDIAVEGGYVGDAKTDSAGRIILAGNFTGIDGTARAGVARVSEAGELDTAFNPGSGAADGNITDLAVLSDDDVLVAGSFTNFSGAGEAYLVRLDAATGAVDTAFAGNTALNGIVNSVSVAADDQIVVGGNFTTSGGYTVNGIDRLNADGTSDANFLPGAGAGGTYPYVYSARPDAAGRIVVAGTFTSLRDEARPAGLGRMTANGPLDPLFDDASLSGGYASDSLTLPDGKILVRGGFSAVDGEPRVALARFHGGWVLRGGLDSAFDGAGLANNSVAAVLPATDGGFWIFGDFTSVAGQPRNRIARLNRFGQLDDAYVPASGLNGAVYGARALPDGTMLVWGAFNNYNGQSTPSLMRLAPDGTRDATFATPIFNSAVRAVQPYATDQWIVGGSFTNVGGVPTGGVVRLNADGSHDTGFSVATGTDNAVHAVAAAEDGTVYAGGAFTSFAGQTAPGLVRLNANGAVDPEFTVGEGAGGSVVRALYLDDAGRLWVGGSFALWDGATRRGLVRLASDGSVDTNFLGGIGTSINGSVNVLEPTADGRVYVAGRFSSLGGGERRGLVRVYPSGTIDPYFDIGEGFNNEVLAVEPLADGRIAVAGAFTQARGTDRNRLAVLYAGDVAPPFIADDQVTTYEIDPGEDLTLSYADIEGMSYQWYRDGVRLDDATAHQLLITNAGLDDLGLYTVRFSNGAGEYTTVGTRVIVRLAPAVSNAPIDTAVGYGAGASFSVGVVGPGPFTYQWYRDGEAIDGAIDTTYVLNGVGDADFGATFYAIVTNAYGSVQSTTATLQFDSTAVPGAIKPAFGGLPELADKTVTAAVRLPDGRIYLGGSNFLYRIYPDGTIDDTFAPNLTSISVDHLILQPDGKLLVAGRVWPVGGTPMDVGRLLPSGAADPTWTMPTIYGISDINGMVLLTDGRVMIGGRFNNVGGTDRWNLALLNSDGSLDEGFGPVDESSGPNGYVRDLKLVSGGSQVLVAGEFTTYAGTTVNGLLRLNLDHSIDGTFGGGSRANGTIEELYAGPNDTWYIRGQFDSYNGTARGGVARLLSNGNLDPNFDTSTGASAQSYSTPYIRDLAVTANGSVVVVGSFTGFGDWPLVNSVRLLADGSVDTQWASPVQNTNFITLVQLADGTLLAGGSFKFTPDDANYTRTVELLGGDYPPQAPAILSQTTLNGDYVYAAGSTRTFESVVSGPGTLTLQWYRDGEPLEESNLVVGVNGPRLTLRSLRTVHAGDYVLRVMSPENGYTETDPVTLSVGPEPTGPGSLDLDWVFDRPGNQITDAAVAADGSVYLAKRDYPISRVFKTDSNGRLLPAGQFNPGTGTEGTVTAIFPLPNGKALVAGTFTSFQGAAVERLALLNADGSVDPGFAPNPSTYPTQVLPLTDGRLLVAGGFNSIAGTARAGLVRLNANGTLDGSFADSHGLEYVRRIHVTSNGQILVVGTDYADSTARLKRLTANGSVDSGFTEVSGPNNSMYTVVEDDQGRVIVGGSFTSLGGTSINRIARFSASGQLDNSFGPLRSEGPSGTVYDVLQGADGYLYVAGQFGTWDGFALGSLVRLDRNGQLDLNFPAENLTRLSSVSDNIRLDWTAGGKLQIDGSFSLSPRSNVVRLHVDGAPGGALQLVDTSGDRTVVEGVNLSLYGRFSGGSPVTYSWTHDGVPVEGAFGPQLLLAAPTSTDAGTYVLTATNSEGTVSTEMQVGFLSADPLSPIPGINLSSGFNNNVYDVLTRADGSRIVVGNFYQLEGVNTRGIAALKADGTPDTAFNGNNPFDPNAGTNIEGVRELNDGTLLVWGTMYMPGEGYSRHYLVRLNANGSLNRVLFDQDSASSYIRGVVQLADGSILIGGSFNTLNGTSTGPVARIDANGNVDTTPVLSGATGSVSGIFPAPDGGVLLAGNLNNVDGVSGTRYLTRLNAAGELDVDFNPPLLRNPIRVAFGPAGEIYAGDYNPLANVSGQDLRLVRLFPDGRLDRSFLTDFTQVTHVTVDPLGRVVAIVRMLDNNWRLIRLLNNGAIDRGVVITGNPSFLSTEGAALMVGGSSSYLLNGAIVRSLTLVNPGDAEAFAIATAPTGGSYIPGTSAALSVGVRGGAGATYQWYRDGSAVPGATGPSLVFEPFAPGDAGSYTLEITVDGELIVTDAVELGVRANAGRAGQVDYAWGVGLVVTQLSALDADAAGNVYLFDARVGSDTTYRDIVPLDANGRERSDFALDPRVNVASFRSVVTLPDGDLLFGGQSIRIDTNAYQSLVRLNADGSLDESVDYSGFTGSIQDLIPLDGGAILLVGSGLNGGAVAKLLPDGSSDPDFTSPAGSNANAAFPAANGQWWVRGNYTDPDTSRQYTLFRINADGTFDSGSPTLRTRYSENFRGAAAAPDGGVYVWFDRYQSNFPRQNRVVRLTAAGEVDPTFQLGEFLKVTPTTDVYLNGMTSDAAGRLIFTGNFAGYDNVPRNGVLRLLPDGSLDLSFIGPAPGGNGIAQTLQFAGGDHLLLYQQNLANLGGVSDRSGLFGLHYGELAADASPEAAGGGTSLAAAPYDPVSLGLLTYAPGDAAVQWFKDGAPLCGETSAHLRILSADTSDSGAYTATVTTPGGSFTTPAFGVTVASSAFPGGLSARNQNLRIDDLPHLVVKRPGGGFLVASTSAAIVNGEGPYELYALDANGAFERGYDVLINGNSASSSLIQSLAVDGDGRIYVGGSFTSVNGEPQNRLVRLTAEGEVDTTFDVGAGPNNQVRAIAPTLDGKVYISGYFSSYNNITSYGGTNSARYLLRLNADGSIDETFLTGTNLNNYAFSLLAESDGSVWVGGYPNLYNGASVSYLLRVAWDGTLDGTFTPTFNSVVEKLERLPDGTTFVSGNFSQVNGVGRSGVAWFDADDALMEDRITNVTTSALDVAPADDGSVFYIYNYRLYNLDADGTGGGDWTAAHNLRGNFQSGINTNQITPRGVLVDGSEVLVWGQFVRVGETTRNGIVWLGEQTSDAPLISSAPASVTLPEGGRVAWTVQATTTTGELTYTWTRADDPGTVLSTTRQLFIENVTTADAGGYRLAVSNGLAETVLVVQLDVTSAGVAGPGDPRLDFNPQGTTTTDRGLAPHPAGGWWVARSTGVDRLLPDGSQDASSATLLVDDGAVTGMAEADDGGFFVWGTFTSFAGHATPYLARVRADGAVDQDFVSPFEGNPNISAIRTDVQGRLYIGWTNGELTIGGTPTTGVARLLPDGRIDESFNPGGGTNNGVYGFAFLPDGRVIIVGNFTTVGSASRRSIARLMADGSLDPSFNSIDVQSIQAVELLPDGKILIGGGFTSVDGLSRPRVARLSADGVVDQSFGPLGFEFSSFTRMAVRPDGRIVVAGLERINNVYRSRIVQFLPDGSLDPSFNWDHFYTSNTSGTQAGFTSLSVLRNGDVAVRGNFSYIDLGVFRRGFTVVRGSPLAPGFYGAPLGPRSAAAGGVITLAADAYGSGTLTYQWRKNGTPIDGATAATLELTAIAADDAGDYDVVVTSTLGTATSAAASVEVVAPPAITTDPADVAVPLGDPASFTVAYTSSGDATVQWFFGDTPIDGATADTYSIAAVTLDDAGDYTAAVTNDVGTTVSESATLTVQTAPVIETNPLGGTFDPGVTIELAVAATGNPTPTYQWFKDGEAIPDATAATLTLANASRADAGSYTVAVENVVDSVTSAAAVVVVNYAPEITTQPAGVHAVTGDRIELTVEADGLPAPTYQWFFNGGELSGRTDATLVIDSANAGHNGFYTVEVTNAFGSVISDPAEVVVDFAPLVINHPVSATVATGGTLELSVQVIGLPTPTLQWRKDGEPISGATGATLTLANVTPADAGSYDVAYLNTQGSGATNAALVTVQYAPEIVSQPASVTIDEGQGTSFAVTVDGLPTPTLQWFFNGTAITDATGPTLSLTDVGPDDAGAYHVVATNDLGAATSETASLTVQTRPTITTQPVAREVSRGDAVTFTVVAEGLPTPTYQWRKDGVEISGETSATLSLSNVQAADAGNYDVVVSNVVGDATSTAVSLTVNVGPVISVQPVGQAALAGAEVTLSVVASGGDPLTYQWRKDGVILPNATASTLTLSNVTEADTAGYDVIVTDPVDSVTSDTATVVVAEVVATHSVREGGYQAGGSITIDVDVSYTAGVSGLQMPVLLPMAVEGGTWSFSSANGAQMFPGGEATLFADWGFTGLPESPFSFSYTINVPPAASGDYELAAWFNITVAGEALQDMVTPDPLLLSELPTTHSADTDGDFAINLSELLRVIELYNTRIGTTRTGRYRPVTGTEDGFGSDTDTAAGSPPDFTGFHSADSDRDAQIGLSELLRVIELYNTRSGTTRTGRYHVSPGTEDGFAGGPGA